MAKKCTFDTQAEKDAAVAKATKALEHAQEHLAEVESAEVTG